MAGLYIISTSRTLDNIHSKYINKITKLKIDYSETLYNITHPVAYPVGSTMNVVWVEYSNYSLDGNTNSFIFLAKLCASNQSAVDLVNFFDNSLYWKVNAPMYCSVPVSGVNPMIETLDDRTIIPTPVDPNHNDSYFASDFYPWVSPKNKISKPNPAASTTVQYRIGDPTTPQITNRPKFQIKLLGSDDYATYNDLPWLQAGYTYERTNITSILITV